MFFLGAWFFATTVPHVDERVDIWLNPYKEATGNGYQILQSIFAQADGGLFGKGFGQALITVPGTHAALLPAAQTDTIYSLIVNELGLFGACGVIADLPLDRRSRFQDRADRQRWLLQAARHRPHRGLCDPGLRHHRRRYRG